MAHVRVFAATNLWAGVVSDMPCTYCGGTGCEWDDSDMQYQCPVCLGNGIDAFAESEHIRRVTERMKIQGLWPCNIGGGIPGRGGG